MFLLSICVPTLNGQIRLEPLVEAVGNLSSPYRDLVELTVSNNVTSEGRRDKLKFNGVERFRLYQQPTNVSFGVNLASSLNIARGSYILLLGDDDLVSTTGLEHLVDLLQGRPLGVYLLALSPGVPRSRGFVKDRYLYMRSGSMMGLCFPNDAELISEMDQQLIEDPSLLYPQVLLTMNYSTKYGPAEHLDMIEVRCGSGSASISDRFFDHMGRPMDFGVCERLRYAKEATKNRPMGLIERISWSISLLKWAKGIHSRLIYEGNYKLARIFALNVARSIDKLSPEGIYWSSTIIRGKLVKPRVF